MPIYLDPIDIGILTLMQQNSKLTNKEIGRMLRRSPSAVFDRIKRLQNEKIIKGFTIVIDHQKISKSLVSHVHIQLKNHSHELMHAFEQEINSYNEVLECANITGPFDYMLKIVVPDMCAYHNFIKLKLAKMPNINSIQTSTVLSERKSELGYPIKNLKLI